MTVRNSKRLPTSLLTAFEADKAHALARHRRNVERLAELMSITPALLYKWLETGAMPANRIAAWEHLTGNDAVVRYLAASGHRVVIDIPTGRRANEGDVHALQAVLHEATGALLAFMVGDMDRDTALANLTNGLEALSWHRENVRKSDQPELELD